MMYDLIILKKRRSILFFAAIMLLSFVSCKKHSNDALACGPAAIISKDLFDNAPEDEFTLKELKITGDCLTVKISAGGCDGSTWVVKLIDAGAIAKSLPPIRTLRLSLDNKELCDALITKELSFDVRNLRIDGTDEIILNVSGQSIKYSY